MSVFFLYGFSLIVRLVREVIKITRGVLARVFFWGFGGWNRGRFWGFLLLSRKCSISSFLNPFFILSHLRLLIFRIFQNPRHFRTARSGVYMGAGLTDSVIRFGFLVEWIDAREETARRGGHSSVEQGEMRRFEIGECAFLRCWRMGTFTNTRYLLMA